MTIRHELTGEGILLVGLNRPEKLNALDEESKIRLGEVWDYARLDNKVKALFYMVKGNAHFVPVLISDKQKDWGGRSPLIF